MGDPRGCRIGSIACALALLLFSCSSDDDGGAAAGASAGSAGKDGRGQSGNPASAGASGAAGTRPNGGGGAGGNSAGRGGLGGSGQGGSTAAPDAGGPIGFPIAGGGGDPSPADSGLPMSLDGSCESNADCELCTGPISLEEPCCPGCPLVSSREICAQIREVMSMCRPAGLGLCPQVACVAPGSPECSPEGKCVMGAGIEQ